MKVTSKKLHLEHLQFKFESKSQDLSLIIRFAKIMQLNLIPEWCCKVPNDLL